MHPYAHDGVRGRTALLLLAVAAVLLAWGFDLALSALRLDPPWWLDTPAVIGFYGLLWRWYDQVLWRVRIGQMTLSGIPDYSGEWTGKIFSSFGDGVELDATMVIRQTASRILIEMQVKGSSRSFSKLAMICGAPGRDEGLQYVYANAPANRPTATVPAASDPPALPMVAHEGMSHMRLSPDGRRLTGDYQNGRFRGTYGALDFGRVS
jgi:hypothetical protein